MTVDVIKLSSSIPASNTKIIDLFNKIEEGKLELRPYFQRKLVWRKAHKYKFIDTILLNYPFPEIYIATGKIDTTKLKSIEWVVDGQQRLSTIREYILGSGDFESQDVVKGFDDLIEVEKEEFLNYRVILRDLTTIDEKTIQEVFTRINSTEYALNTTEKLNASFGDSEFVLFCKQIIDEEFDEESLVKLRVPDESRERIIDFFHKDSDIFSDADIKRMNDLSFMMILVATLVSGYFHRNTEVQKYVENNFEEFPESEFILDKLLEIIEFINSLLLSNESYWFNKANVFTLIVELAKIDVSMINKEMLKDKINSIEESSWQYYKEDDIENIPVKFRKYIEIAKEGVNNKKARISRGEIIREILEECSENVSLPLEEK